MAGYDVIVAGLGIMGSATIAALARRGRTVLGLERFDLGHAMGSSHGATRIIRIGYFEGEAYVPMALRAAELWRELENRLGETVLFRTGTLDCGPENHQVMREAEAACRAHGLAYDLLPADAVNARWPGFRLPAGYAGLFQPDGGFLASDRALAGLLSEAIAHGADIRARTPMLGFEPMADGGVAVRTANGTINARALVVATGPWIGEHVPALSRIAMPERQVLGWFQPRRPELFALGRFPASIMWTEFGHFFHFPLWGQPGFKIGCHRLFMEQGPADALDRETHAADEAKLRQGLAFAFPEADGALLRLSSCLYTMTPDEHFILDHLPGAPQIVLASPCSGHGFKFASLFGEVLADMATGRAPAFDLSMFALRRFG